MHNHDSSISQLTLSSLFLFELSLGMPIIPSFETLHMLSYAWLLLGLCFLYCIQSTLCAIDFILLMFSSSALSHVGHDKYTCQVVFDNLVFLIIRITTNTIIFWNCIPYKLMCSCFWVDKFT